MSTGLNLTPAVSVLPCPACFQTINTSAQICPFCSAPIDHAAATASAQLFARLNQACSDSGFLKVMAGATGAAFLAGLLPFIGFLGILALWFLAFATPVMVIRWFVKFGDLQSPDPEFINARHAAVAVAIVSALVLVVLIAYAVIAHYVTR